MADQDELKDLYLLACLSSAVYSSPPELDQLVGILISDAVAVEFFENPETDTQGAIIVGADDIFVIFRGTESTKIKDWFVDLDVELMPTTHGKIHSGFSLALDSVFASMFESLLNYLSLSNDRKITIAGHSLGGALAMIFAYESSMVGVECDLVTFGAPQVGDDQWADYMRRAFGRRHKSIVNNNDIVPTLPPIDLITGYADAGVLYLLREDGELVIEPSIWERWLDRAEGRLADLFELGTDGIKDHALDSDGEGYIPALANLISTQE